MSFSTHVPLGNLVEITSSKRIFYSEYCENGVPFYRSKEIIEKSAGNEVSTELHISHEKFREIKEKFGAPKPGDLLLTSVGTLGIPYIVNDQEEFYFKDGNLTWFKNFSKDLNSKFLYYWLISTAGKQELELHTIGSTQKALTIQGLKKVKIPLPPIDVQRRSVDILSGIDKKIELNHKTINSLDQLGSSYFNELFRNKNISSNKTVQIGDILELSYGKGLTESKRAKGVFSVVGSSGIVGFHNNYLVEGPGVVVGRKGTIGTVSWIDENFFPIDTTFYVRTLKGDQLPYYYYLLKSLGLESRGSDSAVPGLNRETVYSVKVPSFSSASISSFNGYCVDLFAKKRQLKEEVNTLTCLRDLLLPHLMRGKDVH